MSNTAVFAGAFGLLFIVGLLFVFRKRLSDTARNFIWPPGVTTQILALRQGCIVAWFFLTILSYATETNSIYRALTGPSLGPVLGLFAALCFSAALEALTSGGIQTLFKLTYHWAFNYMFFVALVTSCSSVFTSYYLSREGIETEALRRIGDKPRKNYDAISEINQRYSELRRETKAGAGFTDLTPYQTEIDRLNGEMKSLKKRTKADKYEGQKWWEEKYRLPISQKQMEIDAARKMYNAFQSRNTALQKEVADELKNLEALRKAEINRIDEEHSANSVDFQENKFEAESFSTSINWILIIALMITNTGMAATSAGLHKPYLPPPSIKRPRRLGGRRFSLLGIILDNFGEHREQRRRKKRAKKHVTPNDEELDDFVDDVLEEEVWDDEVVGPVFFDLFREREQDKKKRNIREKSLAEIANEASRRLGAKPGTFDKIAAQRWEYHFKKQKSGKGSRPRSSKK